MADIELWISENGIPDHLQVEVRSGRQLGLGRVASQGEEGYDGRLLNGLLGQLGHVQVAKRIPYALPGAKLVILHDEFRATCAQGRSFDRTIIIAHCEDSTAVALLSQRQANLFRHHFEHSMKRTLPNGQIVEPGDPNVAVNRDLSMEVQPVEFMSGVSQPTIQPGEKLLQAAPSVNFSAMIGRSHSYHCVLHPDHQQLFGRRYVAIRNPAFAEDNPDSTAEVGVVPKYDVRVQIDRIILDETTMLAIGLPHGERVAIRPTRRSPPVIRTRIFGYRHCLCRVTRTGVEYMEKPLARVPQSVFEVLGINPDEQITIERHPQQDDHKSVSLRAVRSESPRPQLQSRMRNSSPDYEEVSGTEDLPAVQMDLLTRTILGVDPGDTVYIRPSVPGVLTREFSSVSLLFAAAIFSAASFRNIEIATAAGIIYLFIVLTIIVRRLR